MNKPGLNSKRVLLAVPHNSGTTYLTSLLAAAIKPDIPYFHAADGFSGTDHVLSHYKISKAIEQNQSFVAPLHVRSSPQLTHICKSGKIDTIVMTRNIYDTIVSLRDRLKKHTDKYKSESSLVFTQTLPIHSKMPDEQIERFLIKFAVPWYFSFVASWQKSNIARIHIRYEDLVAQTQQTLGKAIGSLGIHPSADELKQAITNSKKLDTRLNIGKIGRGAELKYSYRSEISELASLYPGIDFSCILE